jgi:lipoyl(octanoyl) transferase
VKDCYYFRNGGKHMFMEWKISNTPVAYPEALKFMDERVAAIRNGAADECVWLLEHPSLYTAGTSAKDKDLLDKRFPVFKTGRGGQYTYHGPGQRIAYVMMDLKKRQTKPDIKCYVHALEQWIIDTLSIFDIKGERRAGRIGIWVDTPRGDKKIAALGVRVRHWVTLHGISINLHPDLSHFTGIVPCGISDAGVTSLHDLGSAVSMAELDSVLKGKHIILDSLPEIGCIG